MCLGRFVQPLYAEHSVFACPWESLPSFHTPKRLNKAAAPRSSLATQQHLSCSSSFTVLYYGSLLMEGNVTQPFTSFMCGCLLEFFHEAILQSAQESTDIFNDAPPPALSLIIVHRQRRLGGDGCWSLYCVRPFFMPRVVNDTSFISFMTRYFKHIPMGFTSTTHLVWLDMKMFSSDITALHCGN